MATEWTFEKAMTRLEQIVSLLEGGQCTLDESLKLFEEGTKLTAVENKGSAAETAGGLRDRQGEDMGEELSE